MRGMIAGMRMRGKNLSPCSDLPPCGLFHVQSAQVMARKRADRALVEAGLVESRAIAQRLIMAGQVRADGQLVHKSSQLVDPGVELTVEHGPRFVSRGGEKLAAALEAFDVNVADAVCADVGASTGGFTDCLLQQGAARVYAIDVGRTQLHWKLRQDARVISMEGVNVRYLETLPEPIELATIDVSFISLRLVLDTVAGWLDPEGQVIALVKPQFEAGRKEVKRGGVVKDPQVHRRVIEQVIEAGRAAGLYPAAAIRSPLRGPKGNQEFLLWMQQEAGGHGVEDLLGPLFAQRGQG
jgi:23S rRNA (cytidine1920-2'-O)/16S rRNA (cytidine1409-2'-O)-methyltransferase